MRHEWSVGGYWFEAHHDEGRKGIGLRVGRDPGSMEQASPADWSGNLLAEVLHLAPQSIELALLKSILEAEGLVAGTAEGLRGLIDDRNASGLAAEEAREIEGEVTAALAMLLDEPLTPCVEPCKGHLGPKAHEAINKARAAWLEQERKIGEQAAEIERLKAWLEEIGPCWWYQSDGEVGWVGECRRWLRDLPDEGSRCPKCNREVKHA